MEQINLIPNQPMSPQIPVNPPVNPPSSNKTVLIILMILFFVVLSSSVTYLLVKSQSPVPASVTSPASVVQLTPIPDPTAGWKTYTNNALGFSFKYPEDYFKYQDESASSIYLAPSKGNGGNGPKFLETTDLWLEISTETSLDFSPDTPKTPIVIGGFNGNKYSLETPISAGNIKQYQYLASVLANNKFFSISLSSWDQNNLKNSEKLYNQILSTFKFDNNQNQTAPSPSPQIRKISFSPQSDVVNGGNFQSYSSNVGFYMQYPNAFRLTQKESLDQNVCILGFGNDAGGIITVKIVPYNGGSRRELHGIGPGYSYKFEDILIQNAYNGLVIETGPIGESGSGSGVVIPVNDKALIIARSNVAKDSDDFLFLLQSVKINGSLNINNCGK